MLALIAAMPLGDDAPVLLYTIVGIVALLLLIGSIILGKLTRKK